MAERKLVALLAWFDENPGWLADMVSSVAGAGVSHLVAIDGAYELFPKAKRRSPQEQHEALREAAKDSEIGLTRIAPPVPWKSEVAKRNFMFRKAERLTTEQDWYWVLDGDHVVTQAPGDFLGELSRTREDAAEAIVSEPHPDQPTTDRPLRMLFRAIRGLRVSVNHYTYVTPDGRKLWGNGELEDARTFEDLHVLHRTFLRETDRHKKAYDYYRDRDKRLVEAGFCERCDRPAVGKAYGNWEPHPDGLYGGGQGRLAGTPIDVCAVHMRVLEAERVKVFQSYGLAPGQACNTYQNVQ
jgi:hypothetical protein